MNRGLGSIKHDGKLLLLVQQGIRTRRLLPPSPATPSERLQGWQHRLARLFARQLY